MESREISQSEWKHIYFTMLRYNRTEGFVDLVDDKLTFFDSDPFLNNIHACSVTIADVRDYAGY